jgi:ketosteroid isomerase-like protein
MSQENVEIVRQAAGAFTAGDWDRWLEFHDADMEWRTSLEDPDGTTHRGREALRRNVEQWRASIRDLRADVMECFDIGDDRVFTWVRWTGRWSMSAMDSEWWLAIIFTLHDGKVARLEAYNTLAGAFEDLGLAG